MGSYYRVACLECCEEFVVGKLLIKSLSEHEHRYSFGGRGTPYLSGAELLEFVQRFLILHVGHELAFLSDESCEIADFDPRSVGVDEINERHSQLGELPYEALHTGMSKALAKRMAELRENKIPDAEDRRAQERRDDDAP